ncbi:hypothetical protein WV31_19000 [Magnetospirillum sp. ME-1]|uniref:hypothetical protein n=1 Tax=Magnetospirillum sp. ME-1 TaxID=1639348 RepID=UPI000A17F4D5|nr:hypothetical protein [Magnetospirillum sp. ME-1]ARJ67593.1 hypothetical protein WV31_19000 [Magnetospirillum sp. ME-1]
MNRNFRRTFVAVAQAVLRRVGLISKNAKIVVKRPSGSTAGVYLVNGKSRVFVGHLCPEQAAGVGIAAGDRLSVEQLGDDFVLRHAAKGGTTVVATKTSLTVRASAPSASLAKAAPISLVKQKDGSVLVRRKALAAANDNGTADTDVGQVFDVGYISNFTSLLGRAGEKRLKFLAANLNMQQQMATTSAGDQCFTARFFIDLVLRATRREKFDIDCCSMQSDGRYDLGLAPAIVAAATVPSPLNPQEQVPVVGAVPAKRHMTKNDSAFGSLLLPWFGEYIWLNPPYTNRLWAVFLEKAQREIESGRAGTIIALVPMDTYGSHIRHMYGPDAYRIELSAKVPFFMPRRVRPNGAIDRNVVETIKGNSLVVFGKGAKTRDFLLRLLDELLAFGFITEEQAARHRMEYAVWPNLQQAA